jgi:hypothetical protein
LARYLLAQYSSVQYLLAQNLLARNLLAQYSSVQYLLAQNLLAQNLLAQNLLVQYSFGRARRWPGCTFSDESWLRLTISAITSRGSDVGATLSASCQSD